jgi:hypothetical protein
LKRLVAGFVLTAAAAGLLLTGSRLPTGLERGGAGWATTVERLPDVRVVDRRDRALHLPDQVPRPSILLLSEDWCEPCRALERDWLADLEAMRRKGIAIPPIVILSARPQRRDAGNETELERLGFARRFYYDRGPSPSRLSGFPLPTAWGIASDGTVSFFDMGYTGSTPRPWTDGLLYAKKPSR